MDTEDAGVITSKRLLLQTCGAHPAEGPEGELAAGLPGPT